MPAQQDLQQPYTRQNWQTWLSDIFGLQMQFETQAENIEIDRDHIKSIQRFASVHLSDGKNLAVLDIETHAGIQIARNRVGLRNLVTKLIDHARYHGILALYHPEPDLSAGSPTGIYRLSFISSEPTIDTDGNFSVESTAPKRFSYVLGKDEKTKTPAERLKVIADKRGKATLDDVKNAFSVETLTKEFYKELSNWYFWALQKVQFPYDLDRKKLLEIEDEEKRNDEAKKLTELRNATSVIRLITRLIFVWFLRQKRLIADELFDTAALNDMLNYSDKTGSTFYKAILQNLFFATLNTEMGDKRKFVNRQSGIQTLYRYERFFKNKARFMELTKNTPFLNGGLFENLDKNVGDENEIRIDCFSNRIDKEPLLTVPDFLFFGDEKSVDLNEIYDTKGKTYKVRGLIDILKTYNFTIEENTTTDIEVALDPELLGKVFENLLASYNPETQTTARKQTGSFYTPREIVDYMVQESLMAYFQTITNCQLRITNEGDIEMEDGTAITDEIGLSIINSLNVIKILDPACGSGAFPMGILQKMVQILQKLDPQNRLWKQRQLDIAEKIEDIQTREVAIANIEDAFEENELDYGRKLFLIENSIFGIDIQPIAVQISKLRFFISLICEQTPKPDKPNLGIRPLPNLETKFVAANTLIGLDKSKQSNLFRTQEIIDKENELKGVRHKHFSARTPETKAKYRDKDQQLRHEISDILTTLGYAEDTAQKLALWNPYDQNDSSPFFDMEWMFGLKDGFDIVIGNPPYGVKLDKSLTDFLSKKYSISVSVADTYLMFINTAYSISKINSILTYIIPSTWLYMPQYKNFRKVIANNISIQEIQLFRKFVFEQAVVETCTLLSKNITPNSNTKYSFKEVKSEADLKNVFTLSTNQLDLVKDEYCNLIISNDIENNLFVKIKHNKSSFKDIALIVCGLTPYRVGKGTPPQTDTITKERSFDAEFKKDNTYRQFLMGRDFNKYSWCIEKERWISYGKWLAEPRYKAPFNDEKKIIIRQTSDKIIAHLDTKQFLSLKNVHNVKILNPNLSYEYILALLNSKLLDWWYQKLIPEKGRVFAEVKVVNLEQLPIKDISLSQQQPIIDLVNQILSAKNIETDNYPSLQKQVDTTELERQIDKLVYE